MSAPTPTASDVKPEKESHLPCAWCHSNSSIDVAQFLKSTALTPTTLREVTLEMFSWVRSAGRSLRVDRVDAGLLQVGEAVDNDVHGVLLEDVVEHGADGEGALGLTYKSSSCP